MITAQWLHFVAPGQVAVREQELAAPGPGEALVAAEVSAISAGSELLFYRGQAPAGMAVDETLAALRGTVSYPLRYGYATVGRVEALGAGVDEAWQGRLVFAFQPHGTHFVTSVADLLPVPDGLDPAAAALLPNMETAVSLLMDGRPVIGERVAILGQGVVGLLTTWLLGRLPLATLLAVEPISRRRETARALGATVALDPRRDDWLALAAEILGEAGDGADLAYELSGRPAVLNDALQLTGFAGRIVVGSWYGQKQAALDLGGRFHRQHMTLISSQVSRLHPRWTGRWDKARRLQVAWSQLRRLPYETLITHRFPLADAPAAYGLLDQTPAEALQVLFTY